MIEISKMVEKDLAALNGKNIVLCCDSRSFQDAYKILCYFKFKVVAFCRTNNISEKRVARCKSIPMVQQRDLKKYLEQTTDAIIVGSASMIGEENVSNITVEQLINSFQALLFLKKIRNPFFYFLEKLYWEVDRKRTFTIQLIAIWLRKVKSPTVICLPMKTADHSLNATFIKLNQLDFDQIEKITYKKGFLNKAIKLHHYLKEVFGQAAKTIEDTNVWHKPKMLKKSNLKRFETVKIITAVREPIAQNLSLFYEEFPTLYDIDDWFFGELQESSLDLKENTLQHYERLIKENGRDVQVWFNCYIDRYIYASDGSKKESRHTKPIQEFHKLFKEYVFDITAHPFDKERGYAIMKEGNIEVFVYQLEKLNDIIPQLSSWLGVPFDKLENANQASDKWIAASYRQAQKEIEITQEYFDRCFEEPYVKHCYSPVDIENFKAKWRTNIKPSGTDTL